MGVLNEKRCKKLDCKFIRYNPYDKHFDIFILINKIFQNMKHTL